jgi:hypothetical protein
MEVAGVPGMPVGRQVRAIIRPEAVEPGPGGPGRATILAQVVDVSYLGPYVSAQVDGPAGVPLTMTVRASAVDRGLSVGDDCEVGWDHASVWVLPAD